MSLLNLIILIKTNILHPNLLIILIGQSLSSVFFETGRFSLVSQKIIFGDIFNPGHIIFQLVANLTLSFEGLLSHILFFERLMASFLFKKYEQGKKGYFGIIACSLAVSF
uniref:7TM_GPCR_Srx domain-containing protein n=1 Tax=Meloidogyne hapla TaxID=6305 RepID=A0A1I8BK77_MELHA